MDKRTDANRPLAIYKVWLEEGEVISINSADYDYVIVYYSLPSEQQQ